MLAAWKLGREVTNEIGMRSGYGAMRDKTNGDISEAEKLRKYRAMSDRITEKELEQIASWCVQHRTAWGPTHLCELRRVRLKRDRQKIALESIRNAYGLIELKRAIRLLNRSNGMNANPAGVGRKRLLDWSRPAAVLDETQRICDRFLAFTSDLSSLADSDEDLEETMDSVKRIQKQLNSATVSLERLKKRCIVELSRLHDRG